MSADGAVIVGQAREVAISSDNHAFRWTAATGMVKLALPPHANDAFASRVSADGLTIVGTAGFPPPQGSIDVQTEALRWTQVTGMVALGDLAGGRIRSTANDVSADGSVVVGSGETFFQDGVGATNEAFYWTPDTGMLNLRTLLVSLGATGLDGWTLTEARGVSYDGLTIVGTGVHNGVTEAWVATIPEPNTILLAALAAAGMLVATLLRGWPKNCP
jgi:uncharacterized membrane protein